MLQKLEGMYTVLNFRTLLCNTQSKRSTNIHSLGGGGSGLPHTVDYMICMYILVWGA